MDGLSGVFASGKPGSVPSDMDAKIKDLHAKIGVLNVSGKQDRDYHSREL